MIIASTAKKTARIVIDEIVTTISNRDNAIYFLVTSSGCILRQDRITDGEGSTRAGWKECNRPAKLIGTVAGENRVVNGNVRTLTGANCTTTKATSMIPNMVGIMKSRRRLI